jgi:tRNA(fMet)-specific endonuclease VapC
MLDTNVIVKFINGDETARRLINNASVILIPSVVVGELIYGAQKSARAKENLQYFERFYSKYEIAPVDEDVATTYGMIKSQLIKSGINIPDNDIWIAATAKTHHCNLLTYDAHFKSVEGLKVIT